MVCGRSSGVKLFLLAVVLLLALSGVSAIDLIISEGGKIISFYDQYFIYQVDGNITIYNPSNYSLYNVNIPIYTSTLDIRSNQSTGRVSLSNEGIYLFTLGPQESYEMSYSIVGISSEDFNAAGDTVLGYGISLHQPKIYSNIMGSLKKAPLEIPAFGGNPSTRLISVEFVNPTAFNFTIEKVNIIKTPDMDPNDALATWDFSDEKATLDGFEGWSFDFLDEDASEGEVYWLSTEIYLAHIDIFHFNNISRYDQDDLFEVMSNVSLNDSYPNASLDLLDERIFLRKSISSPLVNPGDVLNVTIVINSLEPSSADVTVKDVFPEGFSILSVANDGSSSERDVNWTLAIPSNSVTRLRYQLRYEPSDLLGIDYFRPAVLSFGDKEYYSQTIPFVRQYVPEKKVFVQKKINFLGDDEVRVTLSVQNFGESVINDLVVKEYLLGTAEFREISMPFESRGVWRINNLSQGTMWETTYITDSANAFNVFPDVFGVPQGGVLQSIILANLVSSSYSQVSTRVVEVLALLALAVIILLYFLPVNFFSRTRRQQKQDLRAISHELHALKKHSEHTQATFQSGSVANSGSLQTPSGSAPSMPRPASAPVHRDDPIRVARHQALDESQQKLRESKEQITGKKEEPKKEPDESTVESKK